MKKRINFRSFINGNLLYNNIPIGSFIKYKTAFYIILFPFWIFYLITGYPDYNALIKEKFINDRSRQKSQTKEKRKPDHQKRKPTQKRTEKSKRQF